MQIAVYVVATVCKLLFILRLKCNEGFVLKVSASPTTYYTVKSNVVMSCIILRFGYSCQTNSVRVGQPERQRAYVIT